MIRAVWIAAGVAFGLMFVQPLYLVAFATLLAFLAFALYRDTAVSQYAARAGALEARVGELEKNHGRVDDQINKSGGLKDRIVQLSNRTGMQSGRD